MEKQVDDRTFFRFMSNIFGITLLVFDEAGAVREQYSANPEITLFLLAFTNLKEKIFRLCHETGRPQVFSSELGQLWAGLPVVSEGRITATVVAGPVFTSGGSNHLMLDYVRSYNISTFPREKLLEALNHTPICSYTEFTRLVAIIFAFLTGQELDTSELPITGLTHHEISTILETKVDEERAIPQGRGKDPTTSLEKHMLECIQEGNLEKLKRLLKNSNYANIHHLSLPDPIRQQKDMFISLIAQVASTAIQAGLNTEVAYSLYDRYIQQVETLTNMLPIIGLTREMLYDYTSRVGRLKRTREYSRLVNDCCNYIQEHLYEELRVADVAAFTGHNAHYLSQKFRAETGQSISDFIRDAKISEAKSLLKYSSLSLAEISEQLAFSSQSFFTATFRQATGLTPGQFRENAGS